MATGTIALTNNSTTVTGSSTAFTTDNKVGDFIVAVVGGVAYTLGISAIASNTSMTVNKAFLGPTTSGLAYTPVPAATLALITTQLAADVSRMGRQYNLDKDNWQQIYTGTGNVTVKLTDGSSWTGPAWNSVTTSLAGKADLSGATFTGPLDWSSSTIKATTRTNLGLGALAVAGSVNRSLLDTETFGNLFSTGGRAANTQNTGAYYFNNTPFGYSQYGINLQLSNQVTNSGGAGNGIWQHYLSLGTDGNIAYAQNINGVYAAYLVRSTKNTTVDSSGFIKTASPILRIAADPSNMPATFLESFSLAGSGATNEEAEGVIATRVASGEYAVTGSNGLSTDGWQLEVPRDLNGNRLCFIETDYTDGVLTLKVFKPKFDLETGGIIAGVSMDIPESRWIDLRLDMPSDSIYNKHMASVSS